MDSWCTSASGTLPSERSRRVGGLGIGGGGVGFGRGIGFGFGLVGANRFSVFVLFWGASFVLLLFLLLVSVLVRQMVWSPGGRIRR